MDETPAGQGCGVAVFNTKDFWVEVLPEEGPDFKQFGKQIAVVCDRSVGSGQTRRLHWEITAMDPQTDDILKEMLRKDRGGQKQMAAELAAAVAKQHAARMSKKGLPVEKQQEGSTEKNNPASVQASPAAAGPSPRTPVKAKVSDAILRRMDNFTPSPTVNARHTLGSLDTRSLNKAQHKLQCSNNAAATLPSTELNTLHIPADNDEADVLVDEKGLLQHASAKRMEVGESLENMVPQTSEDIAADR